MQFSTLGNTDLKVSKLCLGSMTFGEQNTEAEAHAQLDLAVDFGINFIDTAEMYPSPPRAETQGLTEEYIGTWLKRRGKRDDLVLASKVSGPSSNMGYIRGGPQLDRSQVNQAVEGSLTRLGVETIDLYQVHWPARPCNYFGQLGYVASDQIGTEIEETLEALATLVEAGKLRYIGVSNETPWGVAQYLRLSEQRGWPRIVSIQNPYNLLNRSFEVGLAEFAHRERVGLLAYSPLGFGVLSGKYLDGAKPHGARLSLYSRFDRYSNPQAVAATKAYAALAEETCLSPAQLALSFVNSRFFTTSNIIGATDLDQLQENVGSIDVALPEGILRAIETIHQQHPNPSP